LEESHPIWNMMPRGFVLFIQDLAGQAPEQLHPLWKLPLLWEGG